MRYLLTGLNHRHAPVELRERIAFTHDDLPAALTALIGCPHVREAMILSTCNRVELLVAYTGEQPDLVAFLAERFPASAAELAEHLYTHRDQEAARHLFRVAASLDSMVVGEPQILGQVKEAFAAARGAGTVHGELERLVQATLGVARRVRAETEIGASSVSIASVAVDLSLKIFGSLAGRRVLLVGAGKMGELAVRHLLSHGAGSITVANRTQARAERLAQVFGANVIAFEQLRARTHQFDIVITSTGSHDFVFRREDGASLLQRRRGRPMFFIDIAVPRDVDPEMNRVDGVFLYDIDDLQSVAAANLADRSREAARAEQLVARAVEDFAGSMQALDAVPALVALRSNVEAMRQVEMRRAAQRLAGMTQAQRETVEAITRSLANKFLHAPTQALRAAAQAGDRQRLEVLREALHIAEGPVVMTSDAPGDDGMRPGESPTERNSAARAAEEAISELEDVAAGESR